MPLKNNKGRQRNYKTADEFYRLVGLDKYFLKIFLSRFFRSNWLLTFLLIIVYLMMVIVKVIMRYTMSKMKQLREQQGLRQIDLAKKANVSLTWLWALENSFHERVSQEIKERVATALKSTPGQLFPE